MGVTSKKRKSLCQRRAVEEEEPVPPPSHFQELPDLEDGSTSSRSSVTFLCCPDGGGSRGSLDRTRSAARPPSRQKQMEFTTVMKHPLRARVVPWN
ncbi:hypothetical protein BDA96_07G210500 [Sorghum bicolor]|uniref:Uncharacterized protein n=2 Tax=Sorghum bicolor TaxID=4558 RepID=A0A921QPM7_SORBI|nr:hypothetical protein BDA96_07G210500 [Sorghum bicolor]KXG25564.1 hypothetical protein SORBI_3007G197900 [Sorghum bicolor]